MSVKRGTVISIVPDSDFALIVVELHGEAEPFSISHHLEEVRMLGLRRGDHVSVAFDDFGKPVGLVFN